MDRDRPPWGVAVLVPLAVAAFLVLLLPLPGPL